MNREAMQDALAQLAICKGVNVQPGQRVVINASVEDRAFARKLADQAWQAKAGNVDVVWSDDWTTALKARHARETVLAQAPAWRVQFLEDAAREGAAFVSIEGGSGDAFAGIDPRRMQMPTQALRKAAKGYRQGIDGGTLAWTIVPAANAAWAARVYPDLPEEEAVDRLWQDLFAVCRVESDALANWDEHDASFARRLDILNRLDLKTLRYTSANGTDLTIELPAQYRFEGGSSTLADGRRIFCNIPTEELFTAPYKYGVNGQVEAVMPLDLYGQLVDHFGLTFQDGKVVDFHAQTGYDALQALLNTEESARYLGEVALVDKNSPIRQRGRLFYNTLLDENAACHLALGQSYAETLENGLHKSRKELEAAGMNQSSVHVDFMIGAEDLHIEGIDRNGNKHLLFENGSFAGKLR